MSFATMLYAHLLIVGSLASPAAPTEDTGGALSAEQLEQLAAPIALYPDALLSQVLMASTYPLEVIEVVRWLGTSEGLTADARAASLEEQRWDPSVKSLVDFPTVVAMMDERLSWTQQLGNAVLSQQKDLMDAIQRLRAKAAKEGNLETTTEQRVTVESNVIVIESVTEEVIYVPVYDSTVVYGYWPYPAYPAPMPYYPRGYVVGAAVLGFAAGVACGSSWGYAWGGCNWRGGEIDIDVDRNVEFNQKINVDRNNVRASGRGTGAWQHDPEHRRGVGYADQRTAQRFDRGGDARSRASCQDFRGHMDTTRSSIARAGRERAAAERPSSTRPATTRGSSTRDRVERPTTSSRPERSSGAFSGINHRFDARSQSSRGRASSGRASSGRSRGGRRR